MGDVDGIDDALSTTGFDRTGQAEAFDSIGDRYDEAFPHKEGQIASGQWLADSLPTGSLVLDLGCGTGQPTARQLVDAGHRVVGVDLSSEMIRLARANVPEAQFHQVDIVDLEDLREGPFDGMAAFFSLLMLNRDEIPDILELLRRQLVENGLLALSMVEADVNDLAIPFLGNTIRVSGYLREDLHQVIEEAGFEILGEDSYTYAPLSSDIPPEIQLFLHCRRRR
ncbi:class I SAM-dependent methyltransferase [Streptomyces sp. NPDC005438]|uniref:class I SAM-dependent DNA methyltransferase n=1 Tax=Streptomyces sp. NPDC005438 TaxID=3156880 RepID=UPI0033AD7024